MHSVLLDIKGTMHSVHQSFTAPTT